MFVDKIMLKILYIIMIYVSVCMFILKVCEVLFYVFLNFLFDFVFFLEFYLSIILNY